jgi:hypothetical protein
MKQEFTIIRYFFYETTKGYAKVRGEERTYYVERVKQCYLQVYSLFDRVANFLNEYMQLDIHLVSYRKIWHEKRAQWVDIRKELKEPMEENPFLKPLYSLSRDLFYEKDDWQNELGSESSDLPKIRNLLAHSFILVTEEKDNNLSLTFNGKVESISIDELINKTDTLITRVRDVLVYLVLFLLAEEQRKLEGSIVRG